MASNFDDSTPPVKPGCLCVRLPIHPEALAYATHFNVCPETGKPLFPSQEDNLKKKTLRSGDKQK